jgi:hypothetical protein
MRYKEKIIGKINDNETNYFLRYEKTRENLFLLIAIAALSIGIITTIGEHHEKNFTRHFVNRVSH